MSHETRSVVACLTLLAAATVLQPLSAQSAQDVLETALERYEARMEGIQNYTVTQTVMGQTQTTRFERTMVDGHPVYRPPGAEDSPWQDPHVFMEKLAGKATLQGTETVDGEACHVVVFQDLTREDFEGMSPEPIEEQDMPWTPEEMTLCLDTDESIVRRMAFTGTVEADGEKRPFDMQVHLTDYREVDGLVHPFRMEMNMKGVPGMGGQDQARMKKAMEQMKQQMDQMPPEMRKRMKKKMQKMQQMMGGEDGMNVTVEVQEIRVNEGASSGRR